MTIKVRFNNGIFEPISPIEDFNLEEGAELDIEILLKERKDKLRNIVGLFSDLSVKEIQKFEKSAQRRPLFEN